MPTPAAVRPMRKSEPANPSHRQPTRFRMQRDSDT
jgi:hypothetical protein